jgi:hypothetical protein
MPLGQLDRAVARMGGRRLCDLAAVNRDRRGLAGRTFAATDVYLPALRPPAFRR